jgi:hypothetical protein
VHGLFDETAFFGALAASGARVLVIGRRALVALGIPVLTADYDLWVSSDDLERLNEALEPLGLAPNHPPAAARSRGRYVLENGDHVDVFVARQISTRDGDSVGFEEVWARRRPIHFDDGCEIQVPCIPDLIRTKKWGMRQKDLLDIQHLEALARREAGKS